MDIVKIQKFLQLMETLDPNLTVQQVRTLLTVYGSDSLEQEGHVPLSDVVKKTGYTLAAVSRNIIFYGPHMKPNKRTPGLNLIERKEDPNNNSKKNLFLTKRGKLVLSQIKEL